MDYRTEEGAKHYLKILFMPDIQNDYRPGFLQSKALAWCVVLVFILKLGLIGLSVNFPKNIFFADITRNSLINFVNQGRQEAGLPPLSENKKLNEAALLKAKDMMKNGYFYHVSPTGITPWHWFVKAGYNYKYAGENLAVGFIDSKEVFNAWYNSTSHRENILNPNFREIGTAIAEGFGENKAIIVVQLFGAEKFGVAETPIKAQKVEETQQPEAPKNEFVLSEFTGPENSSWHLEFFNALAYNYEAILQKIIYTFILMVGAAFMLNIFINFKIQRKDLIFRTLILLILLAGAALASRDILVLIIPHELII